MIDQELRELLEENKRVLLSLEKRLRKIEGHFIWGTVWTIAKIILIVAPLVAGYIYFSPIINQYVKSFQPILEFYGNPKTQEQLNAFFGGMNTDNNNNTNTTNTNTNQQQISNSQTELIQSFCNEDSREIMIQQLCQ